MRTRRSGTHLVRTTFCIGLFVVARWLGAAPPTAGLVGYWKLDEGAGLVIHDSAGTNHGSIHGPKWSSGLGGSGLWFDASRQFLEIPADEDLNLTNELTIALWIQSDNFDTPLVNKLEYWAPGNYDFRTERSGALSFSHEAGVGQPWSHYQSTARVSAGQWHHAAVTVKVGAAVTFYIDGALAGSSPQSGKLMPFAREPLRIGAKPDPYSSFHGRMNELRIYNRSLTAAEVKELAALPVSSARPTAAKPEGPVRTVTVSPEAVEHVNPDASWEQWLGPNRDGKSRETGLLRSWPAEGPALAWCVEGIGEGYSTVTISGQRIYVTGMIDQKEVLFCLDLRGQLQWQQEYGAAWKGRYPEARTTPTIYQGRAYVISGTGRVVAMDAKTGQLAWAVDASAEFGTRFDYWGIAESPLVVDGKVICTPSGTKATMAALDAGTGRTAWASRSLGEESNYCSPILVPWHDRRLIVTMLKMSLIGVDAQNGEILWRAPYADYQVNPHGINPNSPVYADGCIYTTSGYDCGGALHCLSATGDSITRKWVDKVLDCHHGGVVLVDGYLYGSNFIGHYSGNWVCLDWATGKVMYEQRWICKGSITYADGFLYCYEERQGTIGLVRASPERFDVISSFKIPKGTAMHWAHPVICGGRLYVRHGNALMAYDIRGTAIAEIDRNLR